MFHTDAELISLKAKCMKVWKSVNPSRATNFNAALVADNLATIVIKEIDDELIQRGIKAINEKWNADPTIVENEKAINQRFS